MVERLKYGNEVSSMTGEIIANLCSIEGFCCNMPFRITEIAGTEKQFFDVLLFVFGFRRDATHNFARSVSEARRYIATLPKKKRRDLRLNAIERIRLRQEPTIEEDQLL